MSESGSHQEKIPGKKKDEGYFALVFFGVCVGIYASLLVGWALFPKLLYSSEKQPVDFDHAIHNELVDDGCRSCHQFRDDGSFTGIPPLESCQECHDEMQNEEDPREKVFMEKYADKDIEVPWLIYSKQPDCVFFSHSAHVFSDRFGPDEESDEEDENSLLAAKCQVCHGPIGESDHSRTYYENRLTGISRDIWGKNISGMKENTWDRMKMDDCEECHLKEKPELHGKKEACFVCHK